MAEPQRVEIVSFPYEPRPRRDVAVDLDQYLTCPAWFLKLLGKLAGRVDLIVAATWGRLYDLGGGFPSEFELNLDKDIGARLGKDRSQVSRALSTLYALKLAREVINHNGKHRGLRVGLTDPFETLRLARPDLQIRFDFAAEVDTLAIDGASVGISQRLPAEPTEPTVGISQRLPERQQAVSVSRSDSEGGEHAPPDEAPARLMQALRTRLAPDQVEVWLGSCRFSFEPFRLVLPPAVHLWLHTPKLRREVLDTIAAVGAELGFGALDVVADPALASVVKSQPTVVISQRSALSQPQDLASRNSTGVSTSQPAKPATDFWNPRWGPRPAVIDAAEALYDRIGDPTMMRGIAIKTAMLVELGELPAALLDGLIESRAFDFNRALTEHCRAHVGWAIDIARVAEKFRAVYGVSWKRYWREQRRPRTKPR
jgi:hypothetical protein